MNNEFNSEIYGLLPTGIPGVESLAELALNMRWSWELRKMNAYSSNNGKEL